MVVSHPLPALGPVLQPVAGHQLVVDAVDAQLTVETDPDRQLLAAMACPHAVAVAPNLDAGISSHPAHIMIAGAERLHGQRRQLLALLLEALCRRLAELNSVTSPRPFPKTQAKKTRGIPGVLMDRRGSFSQVGQRTLIGAMGGGRCGSRSTHSAFFSSQYSAIDPDSASTSRAALQRPSLRSRFGDRCRNMSFRT